MPPQTVADHHWPTATPLILTAQQFPRHPQTVAGLSQVLTVDLHSEQILSRQKTRTRDLCGHFEGREMACCLHLQNHSFRSILSSLRSTCGLSCLHNHMWNWFTSIMGSEQQPRTFNRIWRGFLGLQLVYKYLKSELVNYMSYHANSFFCNGNYTCVVLL